MNDARHVLVGAWRAGLLAADWWMVTRDEAAMRALGERVAAACGGALVDVQQHGCFNYLTLDK
ncbi:MAG TPA: hypothetical protein PKB14_25045 [Rubrivivax sp.]|nr:hypothetical protein [Rubrivivax sp.]